MSEADVQRLEVDLASKAVLVVSFGPVQGFLASARKTRDLASGSKLLSDLVKAAGVAAPPDAVLIAPPRSACETDGAVANKLLLLVEAERVADVAECLASAARARLGEIAAEALQELHRTSAVDSAVFESQKMAFLEVAWAACPVVGRGFSAAHRDASLALDGRKALRDFGSHAGLRGRNKASVDGRLESALVAKGSERLARRFGTSFIGRAEQLDALGVIRRFWKPDELDVRWPSVPHIAVAGWLHAKRQDPSGREWVTEVERVRDTLDKTVGAWVPEASRSFRFVDRDFSWLLDPPEVRRTALDELVNPDATPPRGVDAFAPTPWEALTEFENLIGRPKPAPTPYYAVIRADGDRVGTRLSQMECPEHVAAASEELARFSLAVGNLATDPRFAGRVWVVYAGGDDLLAFSTADTAVEFTVAVRRRFDDVAAAFEGFGAKRPTLSAGVVLVHAHDPLSHGLKLSADAERMAKDAGRDQLCVGASKRSGGDVFALVSWPEADGETALHVAERLLVANDAPRGLAYELRELAPQLKQVDEEVGIKEVQRILERKRLPGPTGRKLTKEVVEKLLQATGVSDSQDGQTLSDRTAALASLLLVATHLSACRVQRAEAPAPAEEDAA